MKATLLLSLLSSTLAFALPQLQTDTDTLSPETKFTLSFAHPVVSKDLVGQAAPNTYLDITPPLDVVLRWTAPEVAELQVTTLPQLGKTYSFTMRKGRAFADGSPIEAGELGTLPAPPFYGSQSSHDGDSRLPTFVYRFNDAVNSTSASPYFLFRDAKNNTIAAVVRQARGEDVNSPALLAPTRAQLAAGWKVPQEKDMQPGTELPTSLTITPAAPLPVGQSWRLHVSPGLPNADLSAVTPAENSLWVGTISPTEVRDISAVVEVNQPRRLTISFNKSLPEGTTLEQLGEFVSITPVPADLKLTLDDDRNELTFHGDFRTRTEWNVQVKNGLTAEDGIVLKKTVTEKIVFEDLSPRLAVASDDHAQLAGGTRRYDVETVNLSSFRLRIKHLTGDDVIRAFQGYRHYTGDGPNDDDIKGTNALPFELINGTVLADKIFPLDTDLDHSKLIELNWKDYLPEAEPFALLFVSLEGTPREGLESKDNKPVITQTFVQLTDIGLAWKINDSEAFLYAYSCETGRPLPQVKLDIFGEDSAVLHTTRTDADGVARLPREAAGRHLRAAWGNDSFLTAFDREIDTVSMWRFPVRFAWDYERTAPRHVFLFTDRSLYRPGETVHLKGIVRNLDNDRFQQDPKTNPQLTVRDSAQRTILEQRLTLSAHGSFDQTLTLPAETVGRFSATLSWPEEEAAAEAIEDWQERYLAETNCSFDHQFRVEEFRRNAFEVKSALTAGGKLGDMQFTLDANYYQGQPVANGTVKWFLNSNTTGFYPDGYRDYLFCDHREYDSYYWSHYFGYDDGEYYGSRSTSKNGELALDENGHADFAPALEAEEFPAPRHVTITSEVTDARNQTLSSSASLTIHGSETYLGVSRLDQLVRVGDTANLQLVALTRDGKPSADPVTATLTLQRTYNEQVKLKAKNGRVSVRNEERIEELGEQSLTIQPADTAAGGLNIPFAPTKPGRHTLTFSGTDATGVPFRTATVLYVYGSDEYPWAFESGMKIKLVPEKPNYKPGETARILVLSPIEGTALVTLEREGVQSHYIRELRADNPVIEVPVTEANAPNAFVSVLVIKGARDNRREVKEPILRLGYCELMVENTNERLAVSMETPGAYHRPGEEVTVSGLITTSTGAPLPNAEVTLWAEDEGTLAVMGYRNPNPMAFFYAPRQLRTTAGTSLGSFISESPEERYFFNKGFFIGGGDGDYFDDLADLDVRENFDPCAHWAPALHTGPDGRFTATFNSPATLTRYRVLAVVNEGADRFGSGASEFIVNKPLMLEPSVPRFASEGDTLHPKVLVQNSSEHAGTWEVSLQLDSLTTFLEGEDRTQSKTITLQPNGSMALSFDVRMHDTGTSDWTWSARPKSRDSGTPLTPQLDKELSDAVVSRFEVSYPMPLLRETQFVRFEESGQNRNLLNGFTPDLLQGRGELELQFGKSLLLEAGGAIDELLHYPYGCVEQTTSSTIPWIAAKNLRGLSPELSKHSDAEVARSIQAGVNRLLSMQTRDGGLSYWPGGRDAEDWASSYGGMALLLCKEAGAQVPDEAIDGLTSYLIESLKDLDKKPDPWDREILTRACFVLAMADKPQEPFHNVLLDKIDTLNANAKYFLALAIHQTGGEGAQATAERILDTPDAALKPSKHWMAYQPSEAYRLLATSRIRPGAAEPIIDKLFAARNEQGHWHTTWGNAWSVFALGDHASRAKDLDAPLTIDLVTADGPRQIILNKDHLSETVKVPLNGDLKALVSTSGPAYVRSILASKPPLGSQPPVSKGGFKIARTYHRVLADGSTEPLQEAKVGDLLKVQLEVIIPADNSRYVVIDDALPSLFEAVNTDFASQAGAVKKDNRNWNISHQELRDDRAVFFLSHIYKRGTYQLHYYARVTTAGEAIAPPAKIEAMYDPQSYALTASRTFKTPNPVPTAAN